MNKYRLIFLGKITAGIIRNTFLLPKLQNVAKYIKFCKPKIERIKMLALVVHDKCWL